MERLELYLASEKAVKAADEFRAAVLRASEAAGQMGQGVDDADKALDRVGQRASRAAAPVGKVGQEARRSGESMKAASRGARDLDDGVARLNKTASATGLSIRRLLAILGGVATIRAATRAFAEYEDRLAVLGTIAGESGRGLENLERAARNVSRETKLFSTSDAVQGLTELARAGLDSGQAVAALKPTADLATVGLLSLDKSAAIVTKTLAQFNLSAAEAGRVADVLALGANSTNTDVAGLSFSLSKAGVSAKQFGVDLETTVSALGLLANNGVQADRAGTGLSRIMIRLSNPTERARDALRELGLSAEDVSVESNGLVGVLGTLGKANLSLAQSARLVDTEFADLLQQLADGTYTINELETALRESAGTAAEQASARLKTLGGAFANLRGAAEEFTVSAGDSGLAGALKDIANLSAETLRVLSGDAEAFLKASDGAKTAAATVKVLGAALAGLAIGKIATQLVSATRAMLAFNAAAAANPIGLITAAAGGVASAFLLFSDSATEATATLAFQREEADRLEAKYASLREAIEKIGLLRDQGLPIDPGQLRAAVKSLEDLRIQFLQAEKAAEGFQQFTAKLDVSTITSIKDALPEGSDLQKLATLVEGFRAAKGEAERLAVEVEKAQDALRNAPKFQGSVLSPRFQAELSAVTNKFQDAESRAADLSAELGRFGVTTRGSAEVSIRAKDGVELLDKALAGLSDTAEKADVVLQKTFETDPIRGTIRNLIADENERLRVLQLQGVEREKAELLVRAESVANSGLTDQERAALDELAKRVAEGEEMVKKRRDEARELERIQKLQESLPKTLDELRTKLELQLEIARSEGDERAKLVAQQKALAALPPVSMVDKLDPERAEEVRKESEVIRNLFLEIERTEQGRKSQKVERKQDDGYAALVRNLEQSEAAVQKFGGAREDLLRQQAAENELVAAGIDLGSEQANDYLRRTSAIEDLARAQEELGRLGAQSGQVIGQGFENAAFAGENLRETLRNIGEDLARLAFRNLVTNNLSSLLAAAGQSLAGALGGSSAPAAPRTPGVTPRLTGGAIPAMSGQLIARSQLLQRGGRNYSVAEGGGVTPEAIFPLQRDSQGRLGVVAAGGGGGITINMSFPGVRTSQEARSMRPTQSQMVRRALQADTGGRRGLRPRGQ